MLNESEIVQKLWGLCHILRDDGITFHEYVGELTLLLFLKMIDEHQAHIAGTEDIVDQMHLPKDCSWSVLRGLHGSELLESYRSLLVRLGQAQSRYVRSIFEGAQTAIRSPLALRRLVEEFDRVDWYQADVDQFGAAYEGLLQKNAEESKAGAGQYFTPRPLIDCIVDAIQPKPGEQVQDPAAGSAGFLVAADRFIKQQTNNLSDLTPTERKFQRHKAFYGLELVPSTCRLGRMNMLLHGIGGDLRIGDALAEDGRQLRRADVILSNPPFGTKRSEVPTRSDLAVRTSSKQLNFLQHIMHSLSPNGGRAAVVVPDNVLFENGAGASIRRELMRNFRLHTILRLPTGIFYAPDVRTHVLFFCRETARVKGRDATTDVWLYDLRSESKRFTKRSRLERALFDDFLSAFGDDPYGLGYRRDTGPRGRFRRFSREEIAERGDNLNLGWSGGEEVQDPKTDTLDQLAGDIALTLSDALACIEAVQVTLRSLRK